MLKIALPNKGSLSEESLTLVREAGYRLRRDNNELSIIDAENNIDFLFLRPRDIAVYVADGVVDLGVTGRDLLLDSTASARELMALGFGRSHFCYAAPVASKLSDHKFAGLRIATSYPNIVVADQHQRNCQAEIVKLDGAVEIAVELGVADLIADVVDSGATLRQMGLKIIGEPILYSEAILIGNAGIDLEDPAIHRFMRRVEGIIVARTYVIVEYDVQDELLATCCEITPGIEAPTVSPLSKAGWCAVKAMVKRAELNTIIDKLEAAGANGIIVSDIRTCRI